MEVNSRVFSAVNYAMSNVIYVITGESVVVIDTTESMTAARETLAAFRARCELPIRYVIYTHFHGDHVRGASALVEPSTQVIAHRDLPEQRAKVEEVLPYRRRVTAWQFGLRLPASERAVTLVEEAASGYIAPDILVDDEYTFREGNLTFRLYHTEGETIDHLMVFIPEIATLFPGDLYYGAFPMLSNPMRPDRPVKLWAESLQRMRALRPEYLVPSHGRPLSGAATIDEVLGNYARAIRHVHDETVRGINEGLALEEICARVSLPPDLASLDYLQETYGTVAWGVRGVHRQYTGWYSFRPGDLDPVARRALHGAILEAQGGPGPLVVRARRALRAGDSRLALELVGIVLEIYPRHQAARRLEERALEALAETATSSVARNIYRTATRHPNRNITTPRAGGELR
jgi:alkyl sulfatase BDS1-like metallo-beta-lactamase superfamily hydrolase